MVLLHGELCGNGRKERCELVARRVLDAASGTCPYRDCAVIASPATLPDGEYTIWFEGYFATAKRQRGHWVSVGVPLRG